MTAEEKLNAIVAKCRAFLEIAEKRTPGEWVAKYDTSNGWDLDSKLGDRIAVEAWHDAFDSKEQHTANAAFIAACAGQAEAMARSTIAAAQDILDYPDLHSGTVMEVAILAAWPDELLQTANKA